MQCKICHPIHMLLPSVLYSFHNLKVSRRAWLMSTVSATETLIKILIHYNRFLCNNLSVCVPELI